MADRFGQVVVLAITVHWYVVVIFPVARSIWRAVMRLLVH